MKCNYVVLTLLAVGCAVLLQLGCQEEATLTEAPKPMVKRPEPQIGSAKIQAVATQPKARKKGPRITFEKEIHDFGEVGPGTTNRCEFKFTNTGDSLLKIAKVSKTCGCTPYSLAKKEYAPGETGTLSVKYHASKSAGGVTRTLYVSGNDRMRPKVKLTVKARIMLKVAYEPKELKLLLNKENAGCPAITLRSLDDNPFAIKRFRSTSNSISADYDSSVKKKKFILKPKVDVEKLRERLNGSINIGLTHPSCDTVTIRYKTLGRFTTKPSQFNVFDCEPNKPVTREVWVLNNYDEDFEVESVSSKRGTIKVLGQEKVDSRYKFTLEITPPPVTRKTRRLFTDEFLVNIKDGERVRISCHGYYPRKQKKSPRR